MVSSNQRSINEGIRKVVGSSNRGFVSLDPERQPRIVTQPSPGAPATGGGAGSQFRPPQARPGDSPGTTGSRR